MCDFSLLSKYGNIGFYNSVEITEIFLCEKNTNRILNFYTLCVFEEKLCAAKTQDQFLTSEPVKVNSNFSLGIKQYRLPIADIQDKFNDLLTNNQWGDGSHNITIPKLRCIPKQFIPTKDYHRINNVLKNNFYSGSYLIEFFDEKKDVFDFILSLKAIKKYNEVCKIIKDIIPLDLSTARDRIGNIIFQFPITILEESNKTSATWDNVELKLAWHRNISTPPECMILAESVFDGNIMGSSIVDYNGTCSQNIKLGNSNHQTTIRIWRKDIGLLINASGGTYLKGVHFSMNVVNHEPRVFEIAGEMQKVSISAVSGVGRKNDKNDYSDFVNANLYDIEKQQLYEDMSFRQYDNTPNALSDIIELIQCRGKTGVYLWDPFLSPADIFRTLYFSNNANVPLKAIGSTNGQTKNLSGHQGRNPSDVINDYKRQFENPYNNNFGLNLEFRLQHTNYGKAFHDRFLIFPGDKMTKPSVYSLGTSVNSYGKDHHILQKVSHPQPVIDAFDELWEELNNNDCVVWKSVK